MAKNTNIGSLTIGVGVDTVQMKGGLTEIVTRVDVTSKKIKKSFDPLRKTFSDLRGLVVGAFGVAALSSAVRYFDGIEKSVKKMEVSISKARAGAADFGGIAKGIFAKMPVTIDQATSAVAKLANRTNLTGDAFKAASEQAAALNAMTGGNNATGSILVAMKKWGVEAQNFNKFSDILYSISKEAGLGADGINELAMALSDADNNLGQFGMTVEQAAHFIASMKAEGEDAGQVINLMDKAVLKMSNRGIGLVGGWKQIKEELAGARSESEKLEIASRYFGEKNAVKMADILTNSRISLEGGSVAMSSLVADLKEMETPLSKMQKAIESVSVSLSSIVGYVENIGATAKKYDLFGALGELFNPAATLGVGVTGRDNVSSVIPNGDGGLGIGKKQAVQTVTAIESVAAEVKAAIPPVIDLSKAEDTLGQKQQTVVNTAKWMKQSMAELFGTDGMFPTWQATIEDLGKSMRDSIGDSFTAIIMQTESVSDAFRNMAISILNSISKIVVERSIANPIASALTNLVGGIGGNFLSGSSGSSGSTNGGSYSLYNGNATSLLGFADGGTPPVGVPSIVGERGAEIFVPHTSGTVIPNEVAFGGSGSSVVINQYNTFSGGNSQSILQELNKAKSQLVSAVADEIQRGGRLAGKLRTA